MIKRRIIKYAAVLILLLAITGCGTGTKEDNKDIDTNSTAILEDNTMTGSDDYKKALTFMIEKYGFTVEELLGVDVEALIEDYCLESEEYTKEEIQEILEDMGDSYRLSSAREAFSVLGNTSEVPADSPDLPENPDIARLALYINSGSRQQRMAFDFEDYLYYTDDEVPYILEEEQADALKSVLNEAGVSSWNHYYEDGDEPETTGSLRWKLVIVLKDGTICSYGGYTRDMSNLPENFSRLEEVFTEVAESA